MADANQLKIQARREEAAGAYAEASRLYRQALAAMDDSGNLSDPSLLVRVADLDYRQDEREDALDSYLRAVEEYADQGLITNAIAVCNKILRVFPDRVDCHRRLADLHMDVGLTAEARQNLLRFVDEAWDPDGPGRVLEAMRTFLERTPDQKVAVELASRLRELGRAQEALDALESVWEERSETGADVEALKRKAEEIHSGEDADGRERDAAAANGRETSDAGADPKEVSIERSVVGETPGPPARHGFVGRAAAAGEGVVHENGRDIWGEASTSSSGDDRSPVGRGSLAAAPGDLQLVASYRERFIEVRPPDPRSRPPEESPGEHRSADVGPPGAPEDASDRTETPAADRAPVANGDTTTGGEEIVDEMSEPDRLSDLVAPRSGEADSEEPQGSPEEASGGEVSADRPSSRDGALQDRRPSAAGDGELGEEAELRRGLDLVEEMLEMQPGNLDLRERKLRYARRLGDRDAVNEASLDLADALADEGARRSARTLYRRILERDPGNQQAESRLARLDVSELEEKRESAKRAGAAHATPEIASPEEKDARRELGTRLWTEFESSIREMSWLHAATQAYQATGPEALPPLETFEMLAHYLTARERYGDAIEILERAMELWDREDAEMADVLYYLGRAHEEVGRHERAAACRQRLESVDPEYGRIRRSLDEDAGGAPDA